MQDLIYNLETSLMDFLDNFPVKWLGLVLKLKLIPFGHRVSRPSDATEHAIARLLQQPGTARTRLGQGQYLTREPGSLPGELEQTLEDVLAAEPVFDNICRALGEKRSFTQLDKLADEALAKDLISEAEAELLKRTEKGRAKIIAVDDFAPEELVAAIR